jgi:hypothetical protein
MKYLVDQFQTGDVMTIVNVPTKASETVPSSAECLSVNCGLM